MQDFCAVNKALVSRQHQESYRLTSNEAVDLPGGTYGRAWGFNAAALAVAGLNWGFTLSGAEGILAGGLETDPEGTDLEPALASDKHVNFHQYTC